MKLPSVQPTGEPPVPGQGASPRNKPGRPDQTDRPGREAPEPRRRVDREFMQSRRQFTHAFTTLRSRYTSNKALDQDIEAFQALARTAEELANGRMEAAEILRRLGE